MTQHLRIGLMDCNNFFVSCERLFRPDLAQKPVLVLSSNDGCVVSRSQEVKALGIPMGAPFFMVRDICKKEDITVFSSNFTLYRDLSLRVMRVLKSHVDTVEQYSIDEAFFGVTSDFTLETGAFIRADILQKTGIPVSFGVGSTKTIAKAASVHAKKRGGVSLFDAAAWKEEQSTLSVGSIWGIGRKTSAKLGREGIMTVKELLERDASYYRRAFGVQGERLYRELAGEAVDLVAKDSIAPEHSLMSTRSFSKVLHDQRVILESLSYHAARLGEKLRKRGLVAGEIRVLLAPGRRSDFVLRRSVACAILDVPTNETKQMVSVVRTIMRDLYDSEVPYKRAGVVASRLVPESALSGSLFATTATTRSEKKIDTVVDALNQKFGLDSVRLGTQLGAKSWDAARAYHSPRYTTDWSELVLIKAI